MRPRAVLTQLRLAVLVGLALALLVSGCTTATTPDGESVSTPGTQPDPTPAATAVADLDRSSSGLVYAADAHDAVFEPRLSARSYIAVDGDTGEILIARRERQRRPIASLTKIMTALLVIERGDLGLKARVPAEALDAEPNREDLRQGHSYPRRLLLYSALMVSANDSAITLAYDAGGGSMERFFDMMNAKARELGMADTVYTSASGLEDETNYSSARDQVVLARAALEEPVFAQIVRTVRRLVAWPAPTLEKEWLNHNRMLTTYPGTYGVKTGYTAEAGGCLVVAVRRDGHAVIAVVLDSRRVWVDMPRLVDAAFARIGVQG